PAAHATEGSGKGVRGGEWGIAVLLADGNRREMTPDEFAATEESLLRAVLTLWQTSLLRRDRPAVIDEVTNSLTYYDLTFLRELPRLYGVLEDHLAAYDPTVANAVLPSFIRLCSWIGGTRHGHPHAHAAL